MQLILEEICRHVRNWFCDYNQGDVFSGSFSISNGEIAGIGATKTPEITEGVYYRISGSFVNNGVYLAGTDTPKDEQFNGQVWLLHPDAAFLALVEEIGKWHEANGGADSTNMSPFSSESFGGYSYSKSGSGSSGSGTATTWQSQFKSRLDAWRKI